MSSQRGNVARSRPQKHQNKTAFKNNLHDTSQKTKQLNNTVITNVCMKCKEILEWKIKFKKYKILKAPKTCIRCQQKTVKHSYHTICSTCAGKLNVCPKCGKDDPNSADGSTDYSNQLQDFASVQKLLKSLPERKRRTILRCIKKNDPEKQGASTMEELIKKVESMAFARETSSDDDDDDDDDFSEDDSAFSYNNSNV